jgi:hypothetical protein
MTHRHEPDALDEGLASAAYVATFVHSTGLKLLLLYFVKLFHFFSQEMMMIPMLSMELKRLQPHGGDQLLRLVPVRLVVRVPR